MSSSVDYTRLTHTYSMVALDAENQQMGVAMQTHVFEACNGVIWVEPGIGVVASQAASDPFYAFAGFEMMRLGKTAIQTLHALRQCDSQADVNQVAMLDIHGNVAAYTGERCNPEAGHIIGEGYSCQANTMSNKMVWHEMAQAFEQSQGALVDRIMDALEAAERAGGDSRGAQSAAVKIVTTERPSKPWEGTVYDFRVYDNPEPLEELRRLIAVKKGHEQANEVHRLLYEANLDEAKIKASMGRFNDAMSKIPNRDSRVQHQCYYALSLINKGKMEEGLSLLRAVFTTNPAWREIVARMARARPDEPYALILDTILGMSGPRSQVRDVKIGKGSGDSSLDSMEGEVLGFTRSE